MSRLKLYSELKNDILNCKKCDLGNCGLVDGQDPHVIGQGNLNADLMFIAEAPGEQETIFKEPLTSKGVSGKLYKKILEYLGLTREDVFTTNIVACRPPENRDPEIWEINRCKPFFEKQIELINPKMIITFGRFAAQAFLNNIKITKDHGKLRKSAIYNIDIFPLCHPAYLQAYAPIKQRQGFKQDLKILRQIIRKGL